VISKTFSACVVGFEGAPVTIEVSKQNSLPQISITGLPNTVVQESRERIRASLNSLGYKIPSKKLLVHLSPAETKKTGSHFDLPIALALLCAEGFFPSEPLSHFAFLGELNLSGELRPVQQLIPLLESLLKWDKDLKIIIPESNQVEATLLPRDRVFVSKHLSEVIQCVFGNREFTTVKQLLSPAPREPSIEVTLDSILGQAYPKRALVLSLAGNHPLLFEGPPGCGKTFISLSASSLLPVLSAEESLEVSRVYSFFGETIFKVGRVPFRAPHHSISASAFLGGGNGKVIPGELSLAHKGLLFLDELPEFRRDAIEGLREPLENGEIHLHRIGQSVRLPADFSLIAAMNPCGCGYFGCRSRACQCSPEAIRHYRKKISGPILDRFPIYLWLEQSKTRDFSSGFSHQQAKELIQRVRGFLKDENFLRTSYERILLFFTETTKQSLDSIKEKENLSFRKTLNLMRLSLTIALVENREKIILSDLEESFSLMSPNSLL